MLGLFIIYFLTLMLIFFQKAHLAFSLIVLNVVITFIMLLHHSTDIFLKGV